MLKQLRDKAEKEGLPYQTLMKQIIKNYLDEESMDIKEIKARLSLLEIKVATNPGLNKKPSKVTTKVKVKKRV